MGHSTILTSRMKLSSGIYFLLFIGLSKANSDLDKPAETEAGNNRAQKVFSLFTVVTFPNDQCTTKSDTTMKGTCYSESECTSKGGTVDGNCAAGFGVCCMFTLSTCGGTVSQNCTYITNPSYPTAYSTAGGCAWSVTPLSTEICNIRLDFDNFVTGVTSTTGACTDSFVATGPTGRNPQNLCGTLTGMHLYVEQGRSATATTLAFTLGTSPSATWKIKVSQIECSSLARPNPDCEQWFTGQGGTFQSYNFPTVALQGRISTTCIRNEKGSCGIAYNQYLPNTPDSFGTENGVTTAMGAGTFSEGWVEISNGAISSVHGGGVFSADEASAETVPSTVIREGHGNHVVTYYTLAASQVSQPGYKLTYSQIPC